MNDSRGTTLGLAETPAAEQRRSKRSDARIRNDIAADEIRAIADPDEARNLPEDVRPVLSADDELRTSQRVTEITSQPTGGVPTLSESGNLSAEDRPKINQLLEETGSGRKTPPQLTVPAVATYTLSAPSAVDRFTSVADTGWENRWMMGLDTESVDYSVVDFVENIRLTAPGSDREIQLIARHLNNKRLQYSYLETAPQ